MGGWKVSHSGSVKAEPQHGWPKPVHHFWIWTIASYYWILGAGKRIQAIYLLSNRPKENQNKKFFFVLCNYDRIVFVDKVTDIFVCVVFGKHSGNKKGLRQNLHATPFFTFSSSAGLQPTREIKAIVLEGAEWTVTIRSCRQSETSKAGYINTFIKGNY